MHAPKILAFLALWFCLANARADPYCPPRFALLTKVLRRAPEAGSAATFRELRHNYFFERLRLTPGQMKIVKQAARTLGFDAGGATDLREAINLVGNQVAALEFSPGDKGELMAQFGKRLERGLLNGLAVEQRKTANYAFGLAVSRLEGFPESAYEIAAHNPILAPGSPGAADFGQYLPYTKRYLNGDTSMVVHTMKPIAGWDIRELEVNNRFPLGLDHDLRHVHYGTAHPRALATMFTAQRSQNHLRAVLMGQAFESVDQEQTFQEQILAQYFHRQLHMDIEEGMTYIARAPREELERISAKVLNPAAGVAKWAGWRPVTPDINIIRRADDAVDAMVDEFQDYRRSQDPAVQRALNYNKDPQISVNVERKQF